jgi:phosphatidyl-myo-inositol dimannoside synthase
MRLLLVTDTLSQTYGWGTYSVGVLRALARRGLDFRLLSPRGLCEAEDLARLPDHGTVTSFVSETRRLSRLTLANAPRIWRALRDCDAVHCLTEPYAIPAALAAGGKPLMVTLHGTYAVRPFTRPRERPWYELAYRRANRLFPVSHFTESLLPARFRGPRTVVVPHGIDVEHFAAASPDAAATPERTFLLSVGPIKRRKGYHHTLEAFARVHAARPDVEYWIAGGTDDRLFLAEIERQIERLGLAGAVRLLGRVSDEEKVRLYRQCAAFWLLPVSDDSQFEAFGLVYWEANAAGKPIIGARRTGAEGAIEDGDNGFLVDAANPQEAARAALALLDDPALAARMGQAGRRKVRPWDDAAGVLIEQYRAVLGGSLPSVPRAPAGAR